MAKKGRTDKILEQLSALLSQPLENSDIKEIEKAVKSKSNIIVAKAAQVIKKHALFDMIPLLLTAINKFYVDAKKTDKGCFAKIEITDALNSLEYNNEDFYLKGLHYTQPEPKWGGEIDTAAKLRGYCAFALARTNYTDIHFELAELLMDHESTARVYAAKALDYIGGERSELLLRMRILCPDNNINNYGEYFSALISIEPQRSLAFVSKYLDNWSDPLFEEAAFAIGSSRLSEAFEILKECLIRPLLTPQRKIIIVALTLLRTDQSIEYLISLIEQADSMTFSILTETLDVYSEQKEIMDKINAAVDRRKKMRKRKGNYKKEQTNVSDEGLLELLKEREAGNFITLAQLRESISKKIIQKNIKNKK
jgi:HEAT repeat protein